MKQREDSGFKLCSSYDCAGLKLKGKAGSGSEWLLMLLRSRFNAEVTILSNFIYSNKIESTCCSYSAWEMLWELWDASGIVGLSLLKGYSDTWGHRQLNTTFIQFSVRFLVKVKRPEHCYGLGPWEIYFCLLKLAGSLVECQQHGWFNVGQKESLNLVFNLKKPTHLQL